MSIVLLLGHGEIAGRDAMRRYLDQRSMPPMQI